MAGDWALEQIENSKQLAEEIGRVWGDIGNACRSCSHPDCLGYIPVLEEEELNLLEAGCDVIQVNGDHGPRFLDSYFRDEQGRLIVTQSKPQCPYRDAHSGRCTVHAHRPLACHLYPLGHEVTEGGEAIWALHTDCAYVESAIANHRLDHLVAQLGAVLDRMSPGLQQHLGAHYANVETVTKRADGPSSYIVVRSMERSYD